MPAGRPTKYDPEFHPNRYIELSKEGWSQKEIACDFEVMVSTVHNWMQEHPEFLESVTRGTQHLHAWYLRYGRENMGDKFFNERQWANLFRLIKGGDPSERCVAFPEFEHAKTSSERAEVIFTKLKNGELTTKESKTFLEIIAIGMNITEVKDLWNKVEAIEEERKHEIESNQTH